MTANDYPGQGYVNSLWQYTSQPLAVNWEYQTLPRTDALGVSPLDLEGLNEAGAGGWEVCLVARDQYSDEAESLSASDWSDAVNLILVILVVLILFGGFGGFYGYRSGYYGGGGLGGIGFILLILVLVLLFGGGRFW